MPNSRQAFCIDSPLAGLAVYLESPGTVFGWCATSTKLGCVVAYYEPSGTPGGAGGFAVMSNLACGSRAPAIVAALPVCGIPHRSSSVVGGMD